MDRKAKILVVDDDPTQQALLSSKLSERGYQVETAANGVEGLEKCKAARPPDLVILDILMPEMDGYSFVQEFKKFGDLRRTPIVVVTSQASMQDIFRIEGINDYIVKPFSLETLLQKIDKKMQAKFKRILVVDDEPDIVELIKTRLNGSGYEVLTAADGLQGLELARRERPDLIVLDVMIPKLDGYSVCRMLKFDEKYKNIAIVFLSALDRDKNDPLARQVRADAYLNKPYDSAVLLNTIKELLWD